MTGGVHAHQLVATLPIDMKYKLLADLGACLPLIKRNWMMMSLAAPCFLPQRDPAAIRALEEAGITRLAARCGVKAGLIEARCPRLRGWR